MLRLEKVTGRNVWDILKLRVRDEQTNFVAGNDISIIEAYTAVTGGGHAFPFGIYEDQVPVGFLMVGYDTDDYWENAPEEGMREGRQGRSKNMQKIRSNECRPIISERLSAPLRPNLRFP